MKRGLARVFDVSGLFHHLTVGNHILAVARNRVTTPTYLYAQCELDGQYLRRGLRNLGLASLLVRNRYAGPRPDISPETQMAFGLTVLDPYDLFLWDEPFAGLEEDHLGPLRYLLCVQKTDDKAVLLTATREWEDLLRGAADRILAFW